MHFPVSGVEVPIWLPPIVTFVIAFFTSMGGVSGAFLLLPFQVSVLGFTSPSVSATNHVYNIAAIPSGVYRYIRERRMVWPLTWAVIIGTLPGVFLGAWIRITFLPDSSHFRLFAGAVLLYIGSRLALDILNGSRDRLTKGNKEGENPREPSVQDTRFTLRRGAFTFRGTRYHFSPAGVFALCFLVGIVGGAYGIGGGAILAPFFVAIMKLPVYVVAGAALMGTFITSVMAVVCYQLLALFHTTQQIEPDWLLGLLFGLGGFVGMYLGARCQKYVPARAIKLLLCACILLVSLKYVLGYFF
jgi:uncharacterized membrane protein YfcA